MLDKTRAPTRRFLCVGTVGLGVPLAAPRRLRVGRLRQVCFEPGGRDLLDHVPPAGAALHRHRHRLPASSTAHRWLVDAAASLRPAGRRRRETSIDVARLAASISHARAPPHDPELRRVHVADHPHERFDLSRTVPLPALSPAGNDAFYQVHRRSTGWIEQAFVWLDVGSPTVQTWYGVGLTTDLVGDGGPDQDPLRRSPGRW